jgi:hypothetical protein
MRFLALILVVMGTVSYFSLDAEAGQASDEQTRKLIVGSWVVSKKDLKYPKNRSITKYGADGSINFIGYLDYKCQKVAITVIGRWQVVRGKLFIDVTASSNSQAMPIGFNTVDEVLSISADEMILKSNTGEMQYRSRSAACLP